MTKTNIKYRGNSSIAVEDEDASMIQRVPSPELALKEDEVEEETWDQGMLPKVVMVVRLGVPAIVSLAMFYL